MLLKDITTKKREIVNFFINKNIIINSSILEQLNDEQIVSQLYEATCMQDSPPTTTPIQLTNILQNISKNNNQQTVQITFEYEDKKKKRTLQDFVGLFNARFKALEKILQSRQELQNITSISRLNRKTRENISIIGIVVDKQFTKNDNIILLIEDTTATIKAIITKTKQEVYTTARDIVLDEVVGISGTIGENVIFVNNIIFPDIPIINEVKKAQDDAHAIILSDIHIGSVYFLEEEFNRFISWIRCETGTEEQQALAKKVKYIFIVGDMVDGVGIYPAQEKELKIKDILQQYKEFSKFIQQIPPTINIIISTGNHDAVRLAEPQPKIPQHICPEIYQRPNTTIVGNPAIVTIHATPEFQGFEVLLYHGYSYDYYGDAVESIRNSGRHISDRNDLIMKFLLQRRHLAPTYTSTPYIPDPTQDPLLIEKIPDIFLSGHVHKAAIGSYRGVQIISGSCWQAKTAFQEKVGHEPEPCRVPIINLQTRAVKMLRFDLQKNEEQT